MEDFEKDDSIEVFWIDIHHESSWLSEADAAKRPAADCRSLGYFLKKDDEALYLSSTVGLKDKDSNKGAERDRLFIPLGCIKRIKRLINGN